MEYLILFFAVPSIILFFSWRMGYNFQKLKVPSIISTFLASFFYFFNFKEYAIFLMNKNYLLEKLILFLLLFFSIIFLIVVLSVPNAQEEKARTNKKEHYNKEINKENNFKKPKKVHFISNDLNNFSKDSVKGKTKEPIEITDPLKKFEELLATIYKEQNDENPK